MTDIRQGLFDLLKDIIDGEWGPYDDERYWKMVDEELPRLGLKEDRELLHARARHSTRRTNMQCPHTG